MAAFSSALDENPWRDGDGLSHGFRGPAPPPCSIRMAAGTPETFRGLADRFECGIDRYRVGTVLCGRPSATILDRKNPLDHGPGFPGDHRAAHYPGTLFVGTAVELVAGEDTDRMGFLRLKHQRFSGGSRFAGFAMMQDDVNGFRRQRLIVNSGFFFHNPVQHQSER
jgi:hypothetical protein